MSDIQHDEVTPDSHTNEVRINLDAHKALTELWERRRDEKR